MMMKKEARAFCLEQRKKEDVAKVSEEIVSMIQASSLLKNVQRIGIYYPLKYEIDITPLMDVYPEKEFYLPVTKESLSFVKYDKKTPLADGPFKTKEPKGTEVLREDIECFIIPCVGINKEKKRIGYGKGYYDRYLAGYKGLKIGVCYKNSANLDVVLDEFDLILDEIFIGG